MCLGVWSQLGFITDSDVKAAVVGLLELNEDDGELDIGPGYRVSRVRVRVGLAYPRVTCAIP